MDAAQAGSPASPASRQRMTYACEACRASKAKCEPSSTEGICQRCFTSKRECIFRTGPRKRRRRSKLHPAATRLTPPPRAPSKTFTIDVPVQADSNQPDGEDPLDSLKEFHAGVIESLVSDDDDSDNGDADAGFLGLAAAPPGAGTIAAAAASSPAASGSASSKSSGLTTTTTSSSWAHSNSSSSARSTHGFGRVQPQFNLDSATSLLTSFREDMLPYFPVVALPPGPSCSVPSLAGERPFMLLAILAAASSVRSLQGHSLYDEEFRRGLGLKFVSGGERSLELLVGLLIYCAWYPFHLRPKNKQAQQYIRMVGDIVRDLELDEPPAHFDMMQPRADEQQMPYIRAYLSCYYLSAVLASTFQKKHTVQYRQWTEVCCRILDRDGSSPDEPAAEADRTLVWLVRLGHIVEDTTFVNFRHNGVQQDGPQRAQLMYKGLEAQLREWQCQMPADVATKPVLLMANWATEILLYGQPLLRFPSQPNKAQPGAEAHIDPARLLRCAHVLRSWFDYVLSLPRSGFICFTAIEWSYFVITIILGLKLSFPLPHDCPSWDHASAREILEMKSFFEKFASVGGGSGGGGDEKHQSPASASATSSSSEGRTRSSTDVLSASKVVVGIVQSRYDRRVAALEKVAAAAAAAHMMQTMAAGEGSVASVRNCPMFDGSMDPYLETWDDDTFVNTLDFATPAVVMPQTGFHDLWATMTMGWGQAGGY